MKKRVTGNRTNAIPVREENFNPFGETMTTEFTKGGHTFLFEKRDLYITFEVDVTSWANNPPWPTVDTEPSTLADRTGAILCPRCPPLSAKDLKVTLRASTAPLPGGVRFVVDRTAESLAWAQIFGSAPCTPSPSGLSHCTSSPTQLSIFLDPLTPPKDLENICRQGIERILIAAGSLCRGGRTLQSLAHRRVGRLFPWKVIHEEMRPPQATLQYNEESTALAAAFAFALGPRDFFGISFWKRALSIDFVNNFWNIAPELCELESQTFVSAEAQDRRDGLQIELETLRNQMENVRTILISRSLWRQMAGIAACQREWMSDIGYLRFSTGQQRHLLAESPAVTLPQLTPFE